MDEFKLSKAINLMVKTNHMHRCLIDSRVRNLGIHQTQHRILMHLARNGNLPSQKELAKHLEVTPAAITVALSKLESEGYVEKKLGLDNRYNELSITKKGRDLVNKTREAFYEVDSSIFEDFSDSEIDTYITCLEKLQANIKKHCERKDNS